MDISSSETLLLSPSVILLLNSSSVYLKVYFSQKILSTSTASLQLDVLTNSNRENLWHVICNVSEARLRQQVFTF